MSIDNYNTLSTEKQIEFLQTEIIKHNLQTEKVEIVPIDENIFNYENRKIQQQPRYNEKGEIVGYDNVICKKTVGVDGWRRVMLLDMMNAMEKLGNKKIQVLNYIVNNVNSDNVLLKNNTQIAKETKISRPIVIEVFKTLKELEILKQVKNGLGYVLNPVIFATYGSNSKQNRLIIDYEFDDYKPVRKHNNIKYKGKSLKEKQSTIDKILEEREAEKYKQQD